jgi:hypothetical protein
MTMFQKGTLIERVKLTQNFLSLDQDLAVIWNTCVAELPARPQALDDLCVPLKGESSRRSEVVSTLPPADKPCCRALSPLTAADRVAFRTELPWRRPSTRQRPGSPWGESAWAYPVTA